MAFPTPTPTPAVTLEDALAHLPCSKTIAYRKNQAVYIPEEPATCLYLVKDGRIKVSRPIGEKDNLVVDIYMPGEFFGESALLSGFRPEEATAIEASKVIAWTASDIEEFVLTRPPLGTALVQVFIKRSLTLTERIESLSGEIIPCRLARVLLRFGERFGEPAEEGTIRIEAFSHQTLAECVGTSRELVTTFMNRFRREGYVRYSRREIFIREASLRESLNTAKP
jgi:CRP/FNR family transcriptional regulator, cyclic AMP receptor protein